MTDIENETVEDIQNDGSIRTHIRLFLSEVLGTFLLLLFVNGSTAVAVLSAGPGGKPDDLYVCICSGLGLTISLICTLNISGGHVNPALSFALLTLKKISVKRFLLYSSAQYLGAFLGSLCVFGVFAEQIYLFESNNQTEFQLSLTTAKIFTTFPNNNSGLITCAFDQIIGTMLLLIGVMAITDYKNLKMPRPSQPIALGILLMALLMVFGFNSGGALNPARDLSPRITTAICGWGVSVFSVRGCLWFLIPVVCTNCGAVIGAWIYQITVVWFIPAKNL